MSNYYTRLRHDIRNYQNRGLSYLPRPRLRRITQTRGLIIHDIMRKVNFLKQSETLSYHVSFKRYCIIECSRQIIFNFLYSESNVLGLPACSIFGLKATVNARKISMQHFATLLRATCCIRLATLWHNRQHVVWCWIKFENDQIFVATFWDFTRCCERLASSFTNLITLSHNVARYCVKMLHAFDWTFTHRRTSWGSSVWFRLANKLVTPPYLSKFKMLRPYAGS